MTRQPRTILIIDDDLTLGRSLKRLTQQAFSDFKVLWTRNGVAAVKMAHEYAATLRLVVLDVDLPLLDGILIAAHLRALVPGVPIMPFTQDQEMAPLLTELGCVTPVLQHPSTLPALADTMKQAMATPVPPASLAAWVRALQQSGETILQFIQSRPLGELRAHEQVAESQVDVGRALDLLNQYCERFDRPAREVVLARKVLLGQAGT